MLTSRALARQVQRLVRAIARRLHRRHGDPARARIHWARKLIALGLDARIIAAQFGAWIGPTPRRDSSGGKAHLGGITKRGDVYLRSLSNQGAKSAVMTAHKRSDPISQWTAALRDRAGWQKAAVALANKKARIPDSA